MYQRPQPPQTVCMSAPTLTAVRNPDPQKTRGNTYLCQLQSSAVTWQIENSTGASYSTGSMRPPRGG
ncbi:hypothetical protein K438DRAFT_380841 [Mycena galopus ATCC 62051]|nr:hypothetical protein K438DRAFT_380841 [Mycena galopus ATCC 62051]